MSIVIKNMHKEKPNTDAYPWQVRVDSVSPLGNPYHSAVSYDESQRAYAIYMYEGYLSKQIGSCTMDDPTPAYHELMRLIRLHDTYGKLELYCWCSPKPCHAEVIKNYIETFIETREDIVASVQKLLDTPPTLAVSGNYLHQRMTQPMETVTIDINIKED